MTNPDDTFAAYERYRKALSAANAVSKARVFDALAAAGITTVAVTFNGEGDSGQIEDITARAGSETRALPAIQIEIQRASRENGKLHGRQSTLRDAIEQLCYDFLEQEHGGWENNDGAFGEFTFDAARRQIELEFNARFSDFTTSSHTF